MVDNPTICKHKTMWIKIKAYIFMNLRAFLAQMHTNAHKFTRSISFKTARDYFEMFVLLGDLFFFQFVFDLLIAFINPNKN